jgi:hypothetical protein
LAAALMYICTTVKTISMFIVHGYRIEQPQLTLRWVYNFVANLTLAAMNVRRRLSHCRSLEEWKQLTSTGQQLSQFCSCSAMHHISLDCIQSSTQFSEQFLRVSFNVLRHVWSRTNLDACLRAIVKRLLTTINKASKACRHREHITLVIPVVFDAILHLSFPLKSLSHLHSAQNFTSCQEGEAVPHDTMQVVAAQMTEGTLDEVEVQVVAVVPVEEVSNATNVDVPAISAEIVRTYILITNKEVRPTDSAIP